MKIAVLSDIHSNVYALEAVLEDANRRKCEHFFNLGDILYGPIAPRKTYEMLQSMTFITIAGNQDRQIFEAGQDEIEKNATLQFILADLGEKPLQWMRQLPKTQQFNEHIFLCHGSPSSDVVYLLEQVETGQAELRSDAEIQRLIKGCESKMILCGHTHTPRNIHISTQQTIVNPGSVGLPAYEDDLPVPHRMQTGSPNARYAVLDCADTEITVELIDIPYDFERAACAAENRGREDWAHYLRTGQVSQ